jgi:hypothetical protein
MNKNVLTSFVFIVIFIVSAINLSAQIDYYTDKVQIKASVRENFAQWMKKGEFERETDYRQRLKDSSLTAFRQIHSNAVYGMIKSKIDGTFITEGILVYDTEKEIFFVSFLRSYWGTLKSVINIPLSEAQIFKERWEFSKSDYVPHDWCFIDNDLYPKIIRRTIDNKTYTFPIYQIIQKKYYDKIFISKDFDEISLAFNSLGIDNEYLRDVVVKVK